MTKPINPGTIQEIVGVERDPEQHIGRAISEHDMVYILHSRKCMETQHDMRDCEFSLELDEGIDLEIWKDFQDQPVYLEIDPDNGLVPVAMS